MASGTFNDALVNPHDGNRGSYQYPPDSGMDYNEDLPDLNGDEEDYYKQGTGYEDQYGPGVDGVGQDTEGYQDNEFGPVGGTGGETEGYGEADLPDLDGEQEGYDEGFGPEDGEYEPQNDGADEDFEESEGEDSEDEEEGEEEEEEEKDGEDDDFDALGGLGMV